MALGEELGFHLLITQPEVIIVKMARKDGENNYADIC